MSRLSEALERFLEFVRPPPFLEIRLVELHGRTWDQGRVRVRRADLLTPAEYDSRFEALLDSGPPWLNLNACGMDSDILIVGVEWPRAHDRYPRTSINIGGATGRVIQNGWSAEHYLAFE
jgi:hypothetical protein